MAKYMAVFVNLETLEVDGAYKAETDDLQHEFESLELQPTDLDIDLVDKKQVAENIERIPSFADIKKVKAFSIMYTVSSPGVAWIFFNGRLMAIRV